MLGKYIVVVGLVFAVDKRIDIAEGTIASLCRVLCHSLVPILVPLLFRILVLDSCILGQDSQRSSQLLFQSWVPSPMVLFYLLVAFSFTSILCLCTLLIM
jgi:hypothetical protein